MVNPCALTKPQAMKRVINITKLDYKPEKCEKKSNDCFVTEKLVKGS